MTALNDQRSSLMQQGSLALGYLGNVVIRLESKRRDVLLFPGGQMPSHASDAYQAPRGKPVGWM
jgi:hypothetical protein